MNWARWFTQTATRKPFTGLDGFGDPQYGTTESIAVRWEWNRKLIRNAADDEVTSEALVMTEVAVAVGDILVHPDNSKEWPVISVKDARDHRGALHFYEARL
jgi:hypothetical protein